MTDMISTTIGADNSPDNHHEPPEKKGPPARATPLAKTSVSRKLPKRQESRKSRCHIADRARHFPATCKSCEAKSSSSPPETSSTAQIFIESSTFRPEATAFGLARPSKTSTKQMQRPM